MPWSNPKLSKLVLFFQLCNANLQPIKRQSTCQHKSDGWALAPWLNPKSKIQEITEETKKTRGMHRKSKRGIKSVIFANNRSGKFHLIIFNSNLMNEISDYFMCKNHLTFGCMQNFPHLFDNIFFKKCTQKTDLNTNTFKWHIDGPRRCACQEEYWYNAITDTDHLHRWDSHQWLGNTAVLIQI